MRESRQLLEDYVQSGSEAAFKELVTRYVDLVFSTAVRLVEGDTHRAEDVAQTVFLDLARQAAKLSRDTMLGGWLHRDTCFVAAKMMRGERRRRFRERQAAEMNAHYDNDSGLGNTVPILDEVINELADQDRQVILLRFYQRMDLRSIGQVLGSSENAAQKRVARALEQLQARLSRRGVALSAAALAAGLAGKSVTAAPTGLAASITGTILASAATATNTTLNLTNWLGTGIAKTKLACTGAVIVGTLATPFFMQHQSEVRLRTENESLRHQLEQVELLASENQRKSNQADPASNGQSLTNEQLHELLRLRDEVALLRQKTRELEQAKSASRVLEQPVRNPDEREKPRASVDGLSVVARIDLKFTGPCVFNEDTVRTNCSIKIGDEFQSAAVDDDIRTLYATGLFRNVRVAIETLPDGKALTYAVQCKPRLCDIKFSGSARFNEGLLQEQLSSKIGGPADERELFNDSQMIQSFYVQAGFKSPDVKYVFDVDDLTGRGMVTFQITENN